MENQNIFGELHHIGVVVKDLGKAVQFFRSMGVHSFRKSGTPGKNKFLHGQSLSGGETAMVMGRIGNIGIQLTQPIKPPSMSYEFLEGVGEGINHLAYQVDDLETAKKAMINMGYEIIFSSEYLAGGGEIYVDTGNNFCIQLFEGENI